MTSPPRPAPTIIDVARAAGVSKSLVSLAIRGDAGVSEATRARILDVAEHLGYRSNTLARGLARGRTQVLGILVSDLRNSYHADVVAGAEQRAGEAGWGTLIGHGRGDEAVLAQRLDEVLDLGVDGVLVVSAMLDADTLDAAAGRRPLVMVGRPFAMPQRVSVVRNHDERGAELATSHLWDWGHRRIAHLASSHRAAASARRAAFESAMSSRGAQPQVFDLNDHGIESLLDAVEAGQASACFAGNDRTAAAVLQAARTRGLDVPQDFSVVGYDNAEVSALVSPALTTVEQPRAHMGHEAMGLLLEAVGGATQVKEVTLEPRLVARASTAAVPGSPAHAAAGVGDRS